MKEITVNVPDEIAYAEHDLRRFFDAMVYKLRKNAVKGHWETYTVEQALDFLEAEVNELRVAVRLQNSVEITLEGADVANFALILTSIAIMRGQQQSDRMKMSAQTGDDSAKHVARIFAPNRKRVMPDVERAVAEALADNGEARP